MRGAWCYAAARCTLPTLHQTSRSQPQPSLIPLNTSIPRPLPPRPPPPPLQPHTGLPDFTVSWWVPLYNVGKQMMLAVLICFIDICESISIAKALAQKNK